MDVTFIVVGVLTAAVCSFLFNWGLKPVDVDELQAVIDGQKAKIAALESDIAIAKRERSIAIEELESTACELAKVEERLRKAEDVNHVTRMRLRSIEDDMAAVHNASGSLWASIRKMKTGLHEAQRAMDEMAEPKDAALEQWSTDEPQESTEATS